MEIWIIYAILSAFFAALVAILGKVGIANIDSTLATTARAIVMAISLLALSLSLGKADMIHTINSRAFAFIFFSGIAGAASWLFYFFALKHGPASSVASIDRLSVVFVLVLAVLFLGEHLTWKSGIGAALVAAGAVLMSLK